MKYNNSWKTMNLAISNLAWDFSENNLIFDHFRRIGISNIEVVFPKISSWDSLSENSIIEYKNFLLRNKINAVSSQSLFFGVKFDTDNLNEIVSHLRRISVYSNILGISKLVFGSPFLRKDIKLWTDVFYEIDSILEESNISLLIEPNAVSYGGSFFYTTEEISSFINEHRYKSVWTMVDTNNSFLMNRNPIEDFKNYKKYIKHIHVSEDRLKPIQDLEFHRIFSAELHRNEYDQIVTYEVLKTENIIESIKTFFEIYQ